MTLLILLVGLAFIVIITMIPMAIIGAMVEKLGDNKQSQGPTEWRSGAAFTAARKIGDFVTRNAKSLHDKVEKDVKIR